MSERSSKLLPYTTFVAGATYYTKFFTVEFWEDQPPEATYQGCVEKLLPKDIPTAALNGILLVAKGIDRLEKDLSLDNLRRGDFGLGSQPPKSLLDIQAPFVRPYLLTLLLDRLYWAYTYDGSQPLKITIHRHPDHPVLSVPKVDGAREFLDLTPTRMNEHIARFHNLSAIFASAPPVWNSREPAAIREVAGMEDEAMADANAEGLSLDLQKDLVHHASTITEASQLSAIGATMQATSNICAMAAASLFLITVRANHLHPPTPIDRLPSCSADFCGHLSP